MPSSSATKSCAIRIDWGDDDADFYGRAALEYGLRRAAMEAEWARWLVKAIDKRAGN